MSEIPLYTESDKKEEGRNEPPVTRKGEGGVLMSEIHLFRVIKKKRAGAYHP